MNHADKRVGIVHDDRNRMMLHFRPGDQNRSKKEKHLERPDRITITWKRLADAGVANRCKRISSQVATIGDLSRVHSQEHINFIKSSKTLDKKQIKTINETLHDESVFLNNFSWEAAILAAGSFLKVCSLVARGHLDSGVAVIRPPGHHAEHDRARGFCLFNNVAIAARYLLERFPSIRKILIVDWDVHHGNGTQHTFFSDDSVLFFSIHRYDNAKFYPHSKDANYNQVGRGLGEGYNINVPLSRVSGCGDADYIDVWDKILLPVVEMFKPDIILISGGFDAAEHDNMGGYHVTPGGFGKLLQKLMPFAQGKIVMALEGGYELTPLSDSLIQCIQTLLGDDVIYEGNGEVSAETKSIIKKVQIHLRKYWGILGQNLGSVLQFPMKSRVQISPKKRSSSVTMSGNKRRRGRISPKKSVGARPGKKYFSKSRRAGLVFPVGRIARHLKTRRLRLGRCTAVYLAAVLEYLAAEVLETVGDLARFEKKVRILPRHILRCIREDEDLLKLLADVIIPFSGNVLPKYQSIRKKSASSPESLRR